jgi:low affinity Fe/Cu permease
MSNRERTNASKSPTAKRSASPHEPHPLEKFSDRASTFTGSTLAFIIALGVVLLWSLAGPLMHYSERWQLIINSVTTIVTFLMVFLIQRAQNKDVQALQLKLDELLKQQNGVDEKLIRIDEEASESELKQMREQYKKA